MGSDTPRTRRAARVGGLALATAGCWVGWMAWDRDTHLDPVTLRESGPYEAWQVVGCVVCLVVVAVVALRRLSGWVVVPTMSVAFCAAWVLSGVVLAPAGPDRSGDTGLWPIGLGLLFIGMVLGATAVVGVDRFVVRLLGPSVDRGRRRGGGSRHLR